MSRVRVLDVKLRSDQVRASRMRLAALTFSVLFGTLFGLYLLWRVGELALDKLVYENHAFEIQAFEVQTDGVVSADQLRRWAGVKPGDNLFALDLARVKRDLEMVPLISSVSVERVLPRTLRIRVTEREPVAQVNVPRPRAGGGLEITVFHLDLDGYVMLPLDPRQRTAPLNQTEDALPVLIGVRAMDLRPGRRVEAPAVQAALSLISQFAGSPMVGLVDIRRIDVSAAEVLVLTTGQGSDVTFGLFDLERQLRRWREIHDMGRRLNRSLASLDLAVTNNIPARWLDAAAPPAPAPKRPKPARTQKRHV